MSRKQRTSAVSGSLSEENNLVISFEGLDADRQRIPLDDFLMSVTGWRDFITVAATSYFRKKLTLVRSDDDGHLDIRLKEVREGSQEAVFWITVAGSAIGGLLAIKADKALTVTNMKALWAWINSLLDFHVTQKKAFRTIEEIATGLERLAEAVEIETDKENSGSWRFVEYIDSRLKHAVVPIERSATDIVIRTGTIRIHVDSAARRAIDSGFVVRYESDTFFRASVRVRELNLDTGHTRLEVLTSEHDAFSSKLDSCYIEDRSINEPMNRYSQSLHSHEPLDVFVTRNIDRGTGKTLRWKIYGEIPQQDSPLFTNWDG